MRTLFLTPSIPYPTRSGAEQRTQLLHRALSELGAVDVMLMTDKLSASLSLEAKRALEKRFGVVAWLFPRELEARWPWSFFRVFGRAWPRRVAKSMFGPSIEYRVDPVVQKQVARRLAMVTYDLVVCRYMLPVAIAQPQRFAPTLVDVDDFPSEVLSRKLATIGSSRLQAAYWRRQVRGIREVEKRILIGCRHAWVTKNSDSALCGDIATSVLPNIPFHPPNAPEIAPCAPARDSWRILMVGTMGWGPNERAVDRFLADSWPAIRTAEPRATFRIVGFGMSEHMRSRWGAHPGVEPVGFVEDLQAEYAGAAFAICPLWEGGGSSIKVLEALRYGRTVICTPCGARGLEDKFTAGAPIMIAPDMKEFGAACIALLGDPGKAAAIAEEGWRLVSSSFTYSAFRDQVHRAVKASGAR